MVSKWWVQRVPSSRKPWETNFPKANAILALKISAILAIATVSCRFYFSKRLSFFHSFGGWLLSFLKCVFNFMGFDLNTFFINNLLLGVNWSMLFIYVWLVADYFSFLMESGLKIIIWLSKFSCSDLSFNLVDTGSILLCTISRAIARILCK